MPFIAGRLAHATQKRRWSPEFLQKKGAFEHYLKRIWYDIHVHSDHSMELLKKVVGTERLVLGTNFAGWDQPENPKNSDQAWSNYEKNVKTLLRVE